MGRKGPVPANIASTEETPAPLSLLAPKKLMRNRNLFDPPSPSPRTRTLAAGAGQGQRSQDGGHADHASQECGRGAGAGVEGPRAWEARMGKGEKDEVSRVRDEARLRFRPTFVKGGGESPLSPNYRAACP